MERISIDKLEGKIHTSDKVVAIATADWCGQCRMSKLQIEKFKETYPEILFIELDVEGDNLWEHSEYKITEVPTFLFYKDKELIETVIGYQYEDKLNNLLNQFKNK